MTPLVLVHGFMGGSAQWDGCRDTLQQHANVVAVDLPGFGANAYLPPIDSIVGYADWVVRHLRGLGVEEYHLLGHSMGGMIVQEMVRRAPDVVDHLILYGTGAVGVLPGRFETIAQSKKRAAEDGAIATARRISATWFLHSENDPAFVECAAIAELSSPAALQAGLDAMETWTGVDALGSIAQPSLVLWGDGDRTYNWEQTELLWREIPNCNLAVVPGTAHAVHLEKPQLFNGLINEFLRSDSD